jgi:hypothetical protein
MTDISLPAFHHTTTTQCNIKVDYRMGLDLQLYRQYYKQAYNAEVADADLVREMARRFMDADREFQAFKNRQVNSVRRKGPRVGEGKLSNEVGARL